MYDAIKKYTHNKNADPLIPKEWRARDPLIIPFTQTCHWGTYIGPSAVKSQVYSTNIIITNIIVDGNLSCNFIFTYEPSIADFRMLCYFDITSSVKFMEYVNITAQWLIDFTA